MASYDNAPSKVREAISEAARLTGVSEELLVKIIGRESRFNPNAINPKSSARGLGQHLDDTWARITKKAGGRYGITPETSRFDPRASALMTAELAKENAVSLRRLLGRDAQPGELYAAHFLGAQGAADMIRAAQRNPNAPAADLFGKQAAANKSIFYDAQGRARPISSVLADLTSTTGGDGKLRPLAPGALPNIFAAEPLPERKPWFQSAWEGFKAAAELEQTQTLALQYMRQAGDASLAPDPSFRLTPELIQEKTKDLPESYAKWVVTNAHSEAHMDDLVKRALHDMQNEAQLAEMGALANLGLRSAAILTDIPTWVLGAGAAKLAGGAKLGKIALAGRAGLIAAAEAMPAEAAKMTLRPSYDLDDALINGTTAFAFGAGFGAVFGRSGSELDRVFARESARAEREAIERAGHKLTPEGEDYYSRLGAPGPQPVRQAASGGAAATPQLPAGNALAQGRIDVMGGLVNSPIREVRELAEKLDLDAVGNGGATVCAEESAFEYMRRTHEAADALVSRQVNDAWEEFADRKGLTLEQRVKLRDRWDEDVGRQIFDPRENVDPSIARAADAYRPGYQHWLERAKAEGAEWAADVKPNDRYFPMMFDRNKVEGFIRRYDHDGVISVVRQALKAANPKLEDEIAQRVAEKYVRTVQNTVEGLHASRANSLSGLDRDGLVELLTEQGLDPADAKAFVEAYKPTSESGPRNFRRKTVLDDTTKFVPEGGKAEDAFSVRDLTDLNAERVWEKYSRSMAGHVAMVRAGFQTRGAFESHVEAITKGQLSQRMNPNLTDSIAEKNQEALLYLGRSIYGIPHEKLDSTRVKLQSIFGNWNFMTMMGQSGVAQLGDVPKILLKTSMEAAFRTFRIGDIFGVLRKGGPEADELVRDLEVLTGVGTNRKRQHIVQRFMDIDDFYQESQSEKALDKAMRYSKTGANVTAMISGMTPMTDFLGRWAVRAHMQYLADIARGVKKVDQKVLNDMGLGPQELARFKKLVEGMDIGPNGVVRSLNLAKLRKQDPTGVDKLGGYLSRMARTTVLETTPGMLPKFMGSATGRLIGQFRSFSMASHAANTLHNLKMGPAYAAKSFLVTGAWSTLIFAMHTYAKSLGRDDAEEYLNRHLDPVNALTSGFLVRSASRRPGVRPRLGLHARRGRGGQPVQLRAHHRPQERHPGHPHRRHGGQRL